MVVSVVLLGKKVKVTLRKKVDTLNSELTFLRWQAKIQVKGPGNNVKVKAINHLKKDLSSCFAAGCCTTTFH